MQRGACDDARRRHVWGRRPLSLRGKLGDHTAGKAAAVPEAQLASTRPCSRHPVPEAGPTKTKVLPVGTRAHGRSAARFGCGPGK